MFHLQILKGHLNFDFEDKVDFGKAGSDTDPEEQPTTKRCRDIQWLGWLKDFRVAKKKRKLLHQTTVENNETS